MCKLKGLQLLQIKQCERKSTVHLALKAMYECLFKCSHSPVNVLSLMDYNYVCHEIYV